MASEAKLKAMTDAINEAETLRDANDKLHSSLQAETEKRKILHNTIEDMKGDFSPFYSLGVVLMYLSYPLTCLSFHRTN
jgi:hypothetical protein